MNTFRCSNCGFQIQRPTQPFSCPQCGRQAVGLFRLVAFTPPAQGGWPGQPGQPAQPGMQPGMPQQPGWPQQPGMQPGVPQQGMPQQPGMMQPGMPQQAPGGWPAQPQAPQPPANPWGPQPGCHSRPLVVGPVNRACRSSPVCRSSRVCRSRGGGPRSRRFRSNRPIPGDRSPACNRRPLVVGLANRACPSNRECPSRECRNNRVCRSSRVCPSRACRRRRRPGLAACSNRLARRGRGSRRWGSRACRRQVCNRRRASSRNATALSAAAVTHDAAIARGPPAAPDPGTTAARAGPPAAATAARSAATTWAAASTRAWHADHAPGNCAWPHGFSTASRRCEAAAAGTNVSGRATRGTSAVASATFTAGDHAARSGRWVGRPSAYGRTSAAGAAVRCCAVHFRAAKSCVAARQAVGTPTTAGRRAAAFVNC